MNHVLWWITQNAATVALLLPVVLLVARFWRFRPADQHLLWALLLLKLLTPPIVCWPWSAEDLQASLATPNAETVVEFTSVSDADLTIVTATEADIAPLPSETILLSEPEDFATKDRGIYIPRSPTTEIELQPLILPVLLLIWASGAAVVCGWIVRQLVRHAQILRSAKPPSSDLLCWVNQFSAASGCRRVRIKVSGEVASPFVSCLGGPVLIWPASLAGPEQLARCEGVLAHELAHVARGDHWVAWLELAAMPLWWWNPAYWYIRRRLEETRELACDALALQAASIDRRDFAELLLSLSADARWPLSPAAPLATGIVSHHSFHRRLTMLFNPRASGRVSLAGLIVAGLLAAATLPGWAQTTDKVETKIATEPKDETTPETAAQPSEPQDPAAAKPAQPKIQLVTLPADPTLAAAKPQTDALKTIGTITGVEKDLVRVDLVEGASPSAEFPLLVIRVKPTHRELVGQLRIVRTNGKEVVARVQHKYAEPQPDDQVIAAPQTQPTRPPLKASMPRTNLPATTNPVTVGQRFAGETTDAEPRPHSRFQNAVEIQVRITSDGRIVASVQRDGQVEEIVLPNDGKLQLSASSDGRLITTIDKDAKVQRLTRTGTGSSDADPLASEPRPKSTTVNAMRSSAMGAAAIVSNTITADKANLALLEIDRELAQLEVEEKKLLLDQAQELAKTNIISDTDLKLKDFDLRKAQVRLKHVELQIQAAKETARRQ